MKMAHLQYIPGDPRLVDQLVYELKSKGIFDQFRKDCIADVDTRPAYQNLRQRVENSVSTFLSRQVWKPDLNKNQLREKLRKHILDGNYLEQGVERIVDQVVNPKVASVFIPQVEDLVYNYLGITRKKSTPVAETSNGKASSNDLLPTDLEAVSPGSVKSNDDKHEFMDTTANNEETKMDVDENKDMKEEDDKMKTDPQDTQLSGISELTSNDSGSFDKSSIPLPSEEIKLENIPVPENSPPKAANVKVELENIKLPLEPNLFTDIPLPEEAPKMESEHYFKPVSANSDDDDSSDSDSSLIRNMSPLTPIRNFNNENSCDAQQAFEDDTADSKNDNKKESAEPNSFRFTLEAKAENSSDGVKAEKKETETLSYQFNSQVNINSFNTPIYDDSSNSNNLQIDYESDVSKNNTENKVPEPDQNSEDSRNDKKSDEKKSSSHKSSSHRDSHRHSSNKDRRSDSKQSSSKDSKSEKKSSSKDDHKSSSKSSSHKDKSSDRSDKKDSRDSSKHRSSSSHKSSSSHRDSKSHRSSSSSQRHSSSSKHSDEKKSSSSSHKDKSDKSSDKYSKDKSSKDYKSSSSSHRSDKDRKSSSSSKSKSDDKDRQKKEKKDTDDHYSASGRGNHTRRSTDRDSNDGSSSSKGSHNQTGSKSSEVKKESKGSTSKSDNTSTTSGDSTSPSDKDVKVTEMKGKAQNVPQVKPIVRIENHLEVPISSPPRLPFVPDVTLKKPKFAANMEEARKLMKMRKFLDEEQKRMNQEAALLLEFQANVRPSLSQVYSSIPGPELEFACVTSVPRDIIIDTQNHSEAEIAKTSPENSESRNDTISDILTAAEQVENREVNTLEKDVAIKTLPEKSDIVIAEGEVDDDTKETSQKATVQLDNITEAKIDTCQIKIEPSDKKSIAIVENVTNAADESAERISNVAKETTEGTKEVFLNLNINVPDDDGIEQKLQSLMEDGLNTRTEYFQVTIITEELSEAEDLDPTLTKTIEIKEELCSDESPLQYFAEHEKFAAELERDTFSKFLTAFKNKVETKKIHLVNCDTYEESVLREVSGNFGRFEIVNYYKNGHLKLKSTGKNVVRNVNVESEISLPTNVNMSRTSPALMFSPVKSECSFELSSDYDAKLEEMVSKTSRKEIMEIILGSAVDDTAMETSEMPTIGYCNESNIESDTENTMKRKHCEVGSSVNNNRQVLTPNKIRKLSGSDQISSTTEESEETSNNNVMSNPVRSKYLGRARRVGLARPRKSNQSGKSVENFSGAVSSRSKVQRYDAADLYKPRPRCLSRRNHLA